MQQQVMHYYFGKVTQFQKFDIENIYCKIYELANTKSEFDFLSAGGLASVGLNLIEDLGMTASAIRASVSSGGCDSPNADTVADVSIRVLLMSSNMKILKICSFENLIIMLTRCLC